MFKRTASSANPPARAEKDCAMTTEAQAHITTFWDTVAPHYEAHPGNVRAFGTPEYDQWVESLRLVLPSPL